MVVLKTAIVKGLTEQLQINAKDVEKTGRKSFMEFYEKQ